VARSILGGDRVISSANNGLEATVHNSWFEGRIFCVSFYTTSVSDRVCFKISGSALTQAREEGIVLPLRPGSKFIAYYNDNTPYAIQFK
jgi:hypothetical protein